MEIYIYVHENMNCWFGKNIANVLLYIIIILLEHFEPIFLSYPLPD